MEKNLGYSATVRNKIREQVSKLSIDQLNAIPQGMNNNIAWHIGHLAVTSELLCYVRAGVQPDREVALSEKYKNGTRPEAFIPQEEVDRNLDRLLETLDLIQADYEQGVFASIQPYATMTFGVMMGTIEEVFAFCMFHDTLHWGYINAMRKLV